MTKIKTIIIVINNVFPELDLNFIKSTSAQLLTIITIPQNGKKNKTIIVILEVVYIIKGGVANEI